MLPWRGTQRSSPCCRGAGDPADALVWGYQQDGLALTPGPGTGGMAVAGSALGDPNPGSQGAARRQQASRGGDSLLLWRDWQCRGGAPRPPRPRARRFLPDPGLPRGQLLPPGTAGRSSGRPGRARLRGGVPGAGAGVSLPQRPAAGPRLQDRTGGPGAQQAPPRVAAADPPSWPPAPLPLAAGCGESPDPRVLHPHPLVLRLGAGAVRVSLRQRSGPELRRGGRPGRGMLLSLHPSPALAAAWSSGAPWAGTGRGFLGPTALQGTAHGSFPQLRSQAQPAGQPRRAGRRPRLAQPAAQRGAASARSGGIPPRLSAALRTGRPRALRAAGAAGALPPPPAAPGPGRGASGAALGRGAPWRTRRGAAPLPPTHPAPQRVRVRVRALPHFPGAQSTAPRAVPRLAPPPPSPCGSHRPHLFPIFPWSVPNHPDPSLSPPPLPLLNIP